MCVILKIFETYNVADYSDYVRIGAKNRTYINILIYCLSFGIYIVPVCVTLEWSLSFEYKLVP